MGSVYVRELSAGEVFRSIGTLYKENFWQTYLSYALPLLPGYALESYAMQINSWSLLLVSFCLLSAGSLACYTALALCISDACLGNTPNLLRSVARTSRLTIPLVLTSIVQSLAIFGGLLLLIVPGIVLAGWFVFAPIIVVLEGRSTVAALRRSKMLVKGYFLKTFAMVALLTAIVFGWGAIGSGLVTLLQIASVQGVGHRGVIQLVAGTIQYILISLSLPIIFIALILMYYDLRARKEAYDNTVLAAELAR
jgi:hypothetical protein